MVWTQDDIDYLEQNFGVISINAIAKHLNKTPKAVLGKSKRLELGSAINASEMLTIGELAKTIGVDDKTIKNWIEKYDLKASRRVIVRKRLYWRIKIQSFWNWAKTHQDFIRWSKFERNALGKEPDWVEAARKKYVLKPKRRLEKWTTKEDESLRMYWNAGKSVKEIGNILNRSSQAILNRAQRIGLNKKKISIRWKPVEVETLIKMKIDGYTDAQVAEELGRGLEGVAFKRKMLIKENKLNWSYRG